MTKYFICLFIFCLFGSCGPRKSQKIIAREVRLNNSIEGSPSEYPTKLSAWNFFRDKLDGLRPVDDVLRYDLNTPLFSDYAYKARFVKIPNGKHVDYRSMDVLDFPEETILIKNFYYLDDERLENSTRRIIETRLLVHELEGWVPLSYVWNKDQSEALREVAGASIPVEWIDQKGTLKKINYSVPNQIQCKGCHELNGKVMPIGPSAKQLNRLSLSKGVNQLVQWENLGILKGLPPVDQWPLIPIWNDERTGSLDKRARAWLDINCAHCHREGGPAKNTGLYLTYEEQDIYKRGFNKPPVAAGRGSGNLQFDIVPQRPEESILFFRINSLDPGIMMPELGRKLRDEEGVALIKEWIASM